MLSLDDYLYYVDEALEGMIRILTELDDVGANSRIACPGANSPYAILTHCLGVMQWWGGHVVAGRHVERDRDAEFRAEGRVVDLVERTRGARRQLASDVATAEPSAPVRGSTDPQDAGLPLVTSQGGALFHLYEELAQHRGQLEVCRDVLLADWAVTTGGSRATG